MTNYSVTTHNNYNVYGNNYPIFRSIAVPTKDNCNYTPQIPSSIDTVAPTANNPINHETKHKVLSNGEKIGVGVGITSSIALAIALFAKGKPKQAKQVLQHIDFKEAKSIEEAIKYGKETLGIKKYFRIKNLDTLNWINKGLTDVFNYSKGKAKMPIAIFGSSPKSLILPIKETYTAAILPTFRQNVMLINSEFIKNIDSVINKLTDNLLKHNRITQKDNIYKLSDLFQSGEETKKLEELLTRYKQNPNSFTLNEKLLLHDSLRNVRAVIAKINLSPLNILKKFFAINKTDKISYTAKNGITKELTLADIELLETKEQANILKELINNPQNNIKFKIKSSNPYKTIYHELGHIQHRQSAGIDLYDEMGKPEELKALWINDDTIIKDFLSDTKKQQLAGEISKYATSSPMEFVAETFAEMVRGTKLSDEIMALYKHYKGPYFKA